MNVPIFPSPPKKSKISKERNLAGEELTALLAKEMAIMELEGNPIGSLKRHLSAWEAEGLRPAGDSMDSRWNAALFRARASVWRRQVELRAGSRDEVRERGDHEAARGEGDRGGRRPGGRVHLSGGGGPEGAREEQVEIG